LKALFQICLVISTVFSLSAQADLVVYTDRNPAQFATAVEEFEKLTGEKAVLVMMSNYKAIVDRLQMEKDLTHADMVIIKDLIYFKDLKNKGLLQGFEETSVLKTVPSFMRGMNNEWVALSMRARTFVYNPTFLSRSDLSSYDDLADPKWEGLLCLRTSNSSYNFALVSGFIEHYGLEKTKSILEGWMANLAQEVFPNDTSIIQAIAEGKCAVGIVNHYYYAGMKDRDPSLPVEIAFANQGQGGVFTNGTAAALLKTADNKALAQKFVEVMLSERNQLAISAAHFDFPAVEGLQPNTLIKEWGAFERNPLSWDVFADHLSEAKSLFEEVGYN